MAEITTLTALHYNPKQVSVSDVITPPYDVISEQKAKDLLAKSPYNFAHVILPRQENEDYEHAARTLENWKKEGILTQPSEPGMYIYQQVFEVEGKKHCRNTLMCAVRLKDFEVGDVRPHEKTHGGPRKDRLTILKKTQCNLSPIFAVVKDSEGFLERSYESHLYHEPVLRAQTDDGISHNLWAIPEKDSKAFSDFFKDKPVYIVDGHHRYTSALDYAKQLGVADTDHPAAFMYFAIANVYDPALIVFPTHRAVTGVKSEQLERLEDHYRVSQVTEEELQRFVRTPVSEPKFIVSFAGKLLLCEPKLWQEQEGLLGKGLAKLSVVWSDQYFLTEVCGVKDEERNNRIVYLKELSDALERRKDTSLVVFLPPISVESITQVSDEKGFMPQKSTYFYPKLAAGMIMRTLD